MQHKISKLQNLISLITEQSNIHVCIHDISGILKSKSLNIDFQYQNHSKPFCTAAKKSAKGFETCIGCKKKANQKSVLEQEMFSGFCKYGIFEVVKPVVINNRTQCIIYLGNMIFDIKQAAITVHKTCKITQAPESDVISHLSECQIIDGTEYYEKLAGLIDSYIHLLHDYDVSHEEDNKKPLHWAVSTLKNYIEANYTDSLTIKNASALYYINPKYIGRLFNHQVGCTFHEYLNDVRLGKATELLINTDENILHIAMNCGFQNVTYFNRVFLKKHKITPNQFRIKNRQL